jgi:serine/threonine protein kinase
MPEGDTLGGYRLGPILGPGAAEVRTAEPLDAPGTTVVLKIARSAPAAAMLRREADTGRRVGHDRLLRALAARLDHDPPFLVFPHLPGGSVRDALAADGALPASRAAAVFADVLDGMCALHAAGLAHGDLKPENILLDEAGRAVVGDPGLAVNAASLGAQLPESAPPARGEDAAHLSGTWHYMAPEQRAGSAATPAADVYAAGLVLFEMLTGRPLRGVLDETARADLPEWAAAVVESACSAVEHRPADADELRELFTSARPEPSPVEDRRRPSRSHPLAEAGATGISGEPATPPPLQPARESGFAEAARGYRLRLERPRANQCIGRWVLAECLGQSRFGETWKAHRRDHVDEIAVVKIFSEPRFLANLRADRVLDGKLRHPNIAALLETDLHGEQPYVVMEFVPGRPLRERLRRGPMPPAGAAEILRQILAGLSAVHAIGPAHRSLKPENVLVIARAAGGPLVKITDFGLGRAVEETVCQMSMSGIDWSEFAPYWRYLSPEQESGDTGTAASDVYSAGLIYYEMLIGCLPPAVLREETLRDLPGRVRPILTRALAPLGKRFATAAEFLAAVSGPA